MTCLLGGLSTVPLALQLQWPELESVGPMAQAWPGFTET